MFSNKYSKPLLLVLLILSANLVCFAGWITTGGASPTTISATGQFTYKYSHTSSLANPNWLITNGQIVSQSSVGTSYTVVVKFWCASVATSVVLRNSSTTIATRNVTVNAGNSPNVPPTTATLSSNAQGSVITLSTATPTGQTWYYQNAPTGTSTAMFATNSPFVHGLPSLYVRAKYNACTSWSAASSSIDFPGWPQLQLYPIGRWGQGSVSIPAALGTNGDQIRWYSTGSGGSPVATTSGEYTYHATESQIWYVSTYRSANGAESQRLPFEVFVGNLGSIDPTTLEAYMGNPFTLTLSDYSGSIKRWEYNAGNGWISINETSNTLSTTITALPATSTVLYRVVLASPTGGADGTSPVATVTWFPEPIMTSTSGPLYGGNQAFHAYGYSDQQYTLNVAGTWSSYQWIKDGLDIPGATTSSYVTAQRGSYKVRVKHPSAVTYVTSKQFKIINVTQADSVNLLSTTTILKKAVTTTTDLFTLQPHERSQVISYQDGLGRTFQSVGVGQSPFQGDVIAMMNPGKNGLVDSTFLPYATTTAEGRMHPKAIRGTNTYVTSEQYLFYQGTSKVAIDNNPFARTLYKNTPNARVYEQGAPGSDWQPGTNHTVRSDIGFNTSSFTIKKWAPNGMSLSNYANNTLIVNYQYDENNNAIRSFVDMRGLLVLKQVQVGISEWQETFYVYDNVGRLVYQVPPKAVEVLGSGDNLNIAALTELIFKYTYDGLGRLVEKKMPDTAPQYIVYDNLDRIALTQDANLRSTNQWLFVKYDNKNRPVYTGLYQDNVNTTRAAMQSVLNAIDYNVSPWFETESGTGGNQEGYSNTVFPTTNITVMSVNYFDHYNFNRSGDGSADYTYDNTQITGPVEQEANASTFVRGLATASKRRMLDTDGTATATWLWSVVFYDAWGRPIQTQSNNHLYTTVADKTTVVYDNTLIPAAARVLKTKVKHYSAVSTFVEYVDHTVVDHAGRVMEVYRKVNADAEQMLAQYEYNALGQLVDKNLHKTGTEFLQSVDFRYTIRGWLKSINNAKLTNDALNDDTGAADLFGMEYVHNTTDALGNTALYNGNISAVKWKGPGQTSGVADQRSYQYAYDKSNRMTAATFKANTGDGWLAEVNTLNETLTYDKNGNILTLQRNQNQRGLSGITVTSTAQLMDDLEYIYSTNSNRLSKVTDAGVADGFDNGTTGTNTDYTYDAHGSATSDLNKKITSITYTWFGKPLQITYDDESTVTYTYDAAGIKLRMAVSDGVTTDYSGSFVYINNTLSFFASPEGRVVKNGNAYEYQYAIADHQGNTRVVFSSVAPTPDESQTGFETTGTFLGDDTNLSSMTEMNHTSGGTKSQRLTGASNSQVGAASSIKVYPGDVIKAEVYSKYRVVNSNGGNLANFALALTGAFNVNLSSVGELQNLYSGLNNFGTLAADEDRENDDDASPKGFINILVFDKHMNLLDATWDQLDEDYNQGNNVEDNLPWDHLEKEITIRQEGYVYVFLSNENPTQVDIHFDDFKVTHTKSNVVQYNEYYPFGLQTASSWTRENSSNNYLYNQGSELNTTTGFYDLPFRNYDATLGRFFQVDLLAFVKPFNSPFVYASNNPLLYNDPTGLLDATWSEIFTFIDKALAGHGGTWSESGGQQLFENGAVAMSWVNAWKNEIAYEGGGGTGNIVPINVIDGGKSNFYFGTQNAHLVYKVVGYKYEPEPSTQGGWSGLSKAELEKYAKSIAYCTSCSNNELGALFEQIVAGHAAGQPFLIAANFRRNTTKFSLSNRNTVPDFTANAYYIQAVPPGGTLPSFPRRITVREGTWFEAKAKYGDLYVSSNLGQITGHIDNLFNSTLGFRQNHPGFIPGLYIVTTSDVSVSNAIYNYAAGRVNVMHQVAQFRIVDGQYQFQF